MGDEPLRLPYRGGNWNNGRNAGVRALILSGPRTNSHLIRGFRSALLSSSEGIVLWDYIQYRECKGAHFPANKAKKYIAMETVSRLILEGCYT